MTRLSPRLAVALAVACLLPASTAPSIGRAAPTVAAAPAAVAPLDVSAAHATPVPEPTTLAPLAGMAIVAMRRRRVAA